MFFCPSNNCALVKYFLGQIAAAWHLLSLLIPIQVSLSDALACCRIMNFTHHSLGKDGLSVMPGTFAYMAPELMLGERCSQSVDIYRWVLPSCCMQDSPRCVVVHEHPSRLHLHAWGHHPGRLTQPLMPLPAVSASCCGRSALVSGLQGLWDTASFPSLAQPLCGVLACTCMGTCLAPRPSSRQRGHPRLLLLLQATTPSGAAKHRFECRRTAQRPWPSCMLSARLPTLQPAPLPGS